MRTAIDQLDRTTTRLFVEGRSNLLALGHRLGPDEEGQGTAEYVAVIVLIAAVIGTVAANNTQIGRAIREAIVEAFNSVKTEVSG